ncbi:tail protein X [Novosphingobium clariflavum]|uniref:Tail protein X n=1 Tax=Novosphingobium clariflavum TaxID=2029884 RepID=A0ABV6S363_9SPHN
MTSTAKAMQGETLAKICWRVLGTTEGGVVEQAYALNPGLAALGPILPEGRAVTLPEPPAAAAVALDTINAWD